MKYVKPAFMVEEFQLNNSISACTPEEVKKLDAASVLVHCVKTNKHEVFYDNCESNYSQATKVEYNGVTYMQWPVGATDDIECDRTCNQCTDSSAIYNALAQMHGQEYHYAPVTDAVETIINHSN